MSQFFNDPTTQWFNPLRQVRSSHQVAIAFPRRATSFIDRPYDEALAAATVPGCKDAWNIGGILAVFSLCIGAWISLHAKFFEELIFWSEEPHGEEHQIRRQHALGTGNLLGNECALRVFHPLDIHDVQLLDLIIPIAD